MNVMHSMRDGTFWDTAPAPEPTGETLRSRRGRWRHLGACRGAALPPAGRRAGENPDPREQRRFRRPRAPQRIHGVERQDDHRLWRLAVAADAELLLAAGEQGARRHRHRARDFEDYYDAAWHEERGLAKRCSSARRCSAPMCSSSKTESAAEWVPKTPLNDKAKADLIELIDAPPDYLPGKTREEKFEILSQTTYADFLTKICGYDPQLVAYFQNSTEAYFGCGIDGVTALDAWGNCDPGLRRHGPRRRALQDDEPVRAARAHRPRRLHLPFPRRQRLGGARLRAQADPGGAVRLDDGGAGPAAGRLFEARPAG